ncbi:hypothetical protein TrVGV298_003854 [Trichoderma virens]|nr:hypothetical protein TrVGV298_003854 [Trichoderma virens]
MESLLALSSILVVELVLAPYEAAIHKTSRCWDGIHVCAIQSLDDANPNMLDSYSVWGTSFFWEPTASSKNIHTRPFSSRDACQLDTHDGRFAGLNWKDDQGGDYNAIDSHTSRFFSYSATNRMPETLAS